MTMQTDVKAAACAAAATTDVTTYRARIKGVTVGVPAGGGTLTIKDGNGGTTVFSYVAAAVLGNFNIVIPGEGILVQNGISVVTPAGMTATVYYG